MQKVIGLWTRPQMLAAGRRAAGQGGRVLKVKHILASTVSGRALGIHNRVSGVRIAASGAKTWVRRNQPAVLQATTWVIRGVTGLVVPL